MKLENADGHIHVLDPATDVWKTITQIAESGVQEEAFYVLDIGDIIGKHKEWKLKLPRVSPFYAVKCNDSRTVLEVLAALGTGFDCASKVEISKVMDLGVDASRIIYANPAKQASHIRHAESCGVSTMTFDNETELHKIKSLYPTAKLVIRIRCDAQVAQCQLGMKYGVIPSEAPRLLEVAKDLGLNVIGVSFHVGSGCQDPPVFRRAIAAARDIFNFAATLGYHFNLLDIGGGFPGNRGNSVDTIASVVNKALDEYFPDDCEVDIIAEPGRFFVASAFTLATSIHSMREIHSPDGGPSSFMYYINDGVYGSFNCLLYDHATVSPMPLKAGKAKLHRCSVWGPTCDGLDQVCSDVLLPAMQVGEWIIFENMGAYTVACAGAFNGFPVPKIHAVAQEHFCMYLKDLLPMKYDHFTISGALGWDIGTCASDCNSVRSLSSDTSVCSSEGEVLPLFLDLLDVGPIN